MYFFVTLSHLIFHLTCFKKNVEKSWVPSVCGREVGGRQVCQVPCSLSHFWAQGSFFFFAGNHWLQRDGPQLFLLFFVCFLPLGFGGFIMGRGSGVHTAGLSLRITLVSPGLDCPLILTRFAAVSLHWLQFSSSWFTSVWKGNWAHSGAGYACVHILISLGVSSCLLVLMRAQDKALYIPT